jgi:PEP-CTERM motif
MLKRFGLAALLCVATNAWAVATAEISLNVIASGYYTSDPPPLTPAPVAPGGVSAFSTSPFEGFLPQEGDSGGPQTFSGLVVGLTYFIDYAYAVDLSDEGQIATDRFSSFCIGPGCFFHGASVDSREIAFAGFVVGFQQGDQEQPPGQFVSGARMSFQSPSDAFADVIHQSGVVRVTYGTTNPQSTSITFSAVATTFADGGPSPVPEPETYVLLLAGLVLLARRSAAASAGSRRCCCPEPSRRRCSFLEPQ